MSTAMDPTNECVHMNMSHCPLCNITIFSALLSTFRNTGLDVSF